jgi:beta-lactamase superfamily II metal-dependent hydrolase
MTHVEQALADNRVFSGKYYPKHNLISSILLLKYGETRVILGGDAEKASWDEVLVDKIRIKEDKEDKEDGELFHAHLVKVSHHGSPTGLTPGLWKQLTARGTCYAVITPYRMQRLPKKEIVEFIARHTPKIFVTSLEALSFSYKSWATMRQEYNLRRWLRLCLLSVFID